MTDPRPILLGQAPGPRTNPDLPLYPLPKASGGGRLFALSGLTTRQYLKGFVRMNLLREFPGRWRRDDRWPRREARVAAQAIEPLLLGRLVIFIGRNVARAFMHEDADWFEWSVDQKYGYRFAAIPHPSGRNHWYNNVDNRLISQAFWESLKMDLPFLQDSDKMSSVSYLQPRQATEN